MADQNPAQRERQSGRWPWWRCVCAAALPWLVAIAVGIAGAPLWGAVGFGLLTFIAGMGMASIADAVHAAAETS